MVNGGYSCINMEEINSKNDLNGNILLLNVTFTNNKDASDAYSKMVKYFKDNIEYADISKYIEVIKYDNANGVYVIIKNGVIDNKYLVLYSLDNTSRFVLQVIKAATDDVFDLELSNKPVLMIENAVMLTTNLGHDWLA